MIITSHTCTMSVVLNYYHFVAHLLNLIHSQMWVSNSTVPLYIWKIEVSLFLVLPFSFSLIPIAPVITYRNFVQICIKISALSYLKTVGYSSKILQYNIFPGTLFGKKIPIGDRSAGSKTGAHGVFTSQNTILKKD